MIAPLQSKPVRVEIGEARDHVLDRPCVVRSRRQRRRCGADVARKSKPAIIRRGGRLAAAAGAQKGHELDALDREVEVAWPGAWAYLVLMVTLSFTLGIDLARNDPGLLRERMGSPVQRDQPAADKMLLIELHLFMFAWLVLMGLDAKRFAWSSVPALMQVLGALTSGRSGSATARCARTASRLR